MKIGMVTSSFNSSDWTRVQAQDWSRRPERSDADVLGETIHLGRLAEPLGFDSIWVGEHFGTPYSMWPDAMQSLAFWAGETTRVSLGTCVSVLPWHHPVTLASQAAMLDIMLDGRSFVWGVGRGVAKTEYAELGIDRSEARGRFGEVLEVIRRGLRSERFSFDGEYFQIPEATIRPQPRSTRMLDDMVCAFTTPESMEVAVGQGLGQLFVAGTPLDEMAQKVRTYNTLRAEHGFGPDQPIVLLWLYCTEDGPEDVAYGEYCFSQYGSEAGIHYGFTDPTSFDGVKGYERYAEQAREDARTGRVSTSQGLAKAQVDTQPIGTPEQVYERILRIQEQTSCKEVLLVPQYSGMPLDKAEKSVRLFAEKVLPRLQAVPATLHATSLPESVVA